jgi:MFS family permease
MDIITLILGIILLTLGKRLYWLFVAVVGFVIGLVVAGTYIQLEPPWLVYVVAIGVGVIGAILATFLQKIAIALVGFIVGGYGAYYLASTYLTIPNDTTNLVAFIVGGIVGLILVASLFNWALYILSSWAGATLITQAVNANVTLSPEFTMAIFFILFVLGMVIQAGLLRERPRPKAIPPSQNVQPPNKEEN